MEEQKQVAKTVAKTVASTNDLDIKDLSDCEIRKTEAEYEGKENVILENLKNCKVYLPFKIKSLYAKHLENCQIFAGCVSGAFFVNHAINCHLHICSHQIRIHNSQNTTFHLIAKSNPIIEHCSSMTFTPYNCTYAGLEEHQRDTGLYDIKNFWDQVLDFNWHRQEKSPNWSTAAGEAETFVIG